MSTDITHKRLFDLVRYARSPLHDAGLVTDEEYAWLCLAESTGDGSPSARRLEDYDELKRKLADAKAAIVSLDIAAEFTAECARFDKLPAPNCACHLCAPCSDCVENGSGREAMKALEDARSKPIVQEALAEWEKSITP